MPKPTWRCRLWGCTVTDCPGCDRCGEYLYGPGFVERGLLTPAEHLWWRLKRRAARIWRGCKCEECGKPMGRQYVNRNDWEIFCSKSCEDKWIPF